MRIVLVLCVVLLVALPAIAEVIPFDSDRWVNLNGEVGEYEGVPCRTGSAYLPNIAFTNGVIEYDVLLDGSRGYPGVTFRATGITSYEHLYIRPHAGLRGDGMQYAPTFGPGSDWQLYHGPGYTASISMPTDRWIHMRIEILGKQARVFWDGAAEPVLVVDDLKHEPAAGAIGIRSAPNASARFANFSVTKTDDLVFEPPVEARQPRGLIREWEISQAFKMTDVDASGYPDAELMKTIEWTKAETEPNGLLNISRYARRSGGGQSDVVFARISLEAKEAETREFTFGYSDVVTVFLNGKPLFSGNNAYRSRNADHPGVISLHDQVYLDLKKGKNELLFAVAENFGGWGLMGQDNGDDYLHPKLKQAWRLEQGNRLPESALYDAERDVLYVTQYFQGGNEYISRVGLDGEVLDREWIGGLQRPTGLLLDGDRLWTVTRRALVEIDVEKGEIAATHPIPGARFPNDVAMGDDGALYVTDTDGSKIHRFADGEFSVWLENADRPNGALFDGGKLYFGTSDSGKLQEIDPETKQIRTVLSLGQGANIDGLRPDGNGGFILSAFDGLIYRATKAGELTPILDTTASGTKSADLDWIPSKQLLVVPGLFDNRLTAYHFTGI